MRPRKKPSRLEVHRLKFKFSGGRGPLLTFKQLDDYEKDLVQRDLLADVRVKRLTFTEPTDEHMFDTIYLQVLSDWGIMCTHPYYSVEPIPHTKGYRCKVCSCAILWPMTKQKLANEG